jgi:hypothetical protein
MKIKDIEITNEEMNLAIQNLLRLKGVEVTVLLIEGVGYPRRAWQVDLEATMVETPKIQTAEELGKAIEEGKV